MGLLPRLPAEDAAPIRSRLALDPAGNLLPLALLETPDHVLPEHARVSASAWLENEGIEASVVVGGRDELWLPSGRSAALARLTGALAAEGRTPRALRGEPAAVEAVLGALSSPATLTDRTDRLFTVTADDLGPYVSAHLRAATLDDAAAIEQLTVEAVRETTGLDAHALAEGRLRRKVEARIAAHRCWVMSNEAGVVFKVELGARCRAGGELEGAFLAPLLRRRGLGTLALGGTCRLLLASLPRLSMLARPDDEATAATCLKVGFHEAGRLRTVTLASA